MVQCGSHNEKSKALGRIILLKKKLAPRGVPAVTVQASAVAVPFRSLQGFYKGVTRGLRFRTEGYWV